MQSFFPRPDNSRNHNLVQIKAGKCVMELLPTGKYMVTPEIRRGLISLFRTPDGMLKFKYEDRVTNAVLEEFFVFAEEVSTIIYRKYFH
jgi:hypothetical protein